MLRLLVRTVPLKVQRSNWARTLSPLCSTRFFADKATSAIQLDHHEDGLPRYPRLTSHGLLRSADLFGTAVFAFGGAITAGVAGMDLMGCVIVGTITSVGGGTIRDTIILRKQPFWIEEPEYIVICFIFAGLSFFIWPFLESQYGLTDSDDWMNWADNLSLAAFCVIGAQNG
jgi:hypothetical protein